MPRFPDLAKLQEAERLYGRELQAHGIEEWTAERASRLEIHDDIEVDVDQTEVCVIEAGEAIMTPGAAACHAVCARVPIAGGGAVVGICHTTGAAVGSDLEVAHETLSGLLEDVTEVAATIARKRAIQGAVELYVLGGAVCLELQEDNPAESPLKSVEFGMCLLQAARAQHVNVVSARLGLSEDGHETTGRPSSIDVYLPATGNVGYVRRERLAPPSLTRPDERLI